MSRDQEAAEWATGLLEETLKRRELRTQAIAPYLYPFTLGSDGVAQLPATPISAGNPPDLERAIAGLDALGDPMYAYLYLMPGIPTPAAEWRGPSFTSGQRAAIPLGVPQEIIEKGDFDFYVFGAFVSPTVKRTFCIPLKGDTFGKLRVLSGLYGGLFSSIHGIGEH